MKGELTMNNKRRANLRKGIETLDRALDIIQDVLLEEECAYDNLSEGLQATLRGEQMSDNVDVLSEVVDKISEIISDLETVD